MKRDSLLIFSTFLFLFSCSQATKEGKESEAALISAPKPVVNNGILTPELMWAFGRVGSPAISPDGSKMIYPVTWYDIKQNKGNTELFSMNIDGSDNKQITSTPKGENQPTWRPDGKKLGFISSESGSPQLWEMNADGSDRKQISNIEGGISGFAYAPDQSKIIYLADVAAEKVNPDLFKDLDKTTGRLMNDLMYRHWDSWVDTYTHIFLADYKDGQQITTGKDLLENEKWDSPVKPWGGMEQITWSPDGKQIVYTSRKLIGKAYSLSTNSDLYLYDIASGKTTNLTTGMMGYDQNPVFSPDGKYLACESMERDGYEADQVRLFVKDMSTGQDIYLTKDFDQDAHNLTWTKDSKTIYFISNYQGTDEIYTISVNDKKITRLTEGIHDYTGIAFAGDKLIATKMSMSKPVEIYSVDPATGTDTELSFINKDLLAQLKLGTVTKRWIKTTDGKQMLTWVILPVDFDSTKQYPALLYCQGGPQSTVSQFWSYRWNFQIMAANGYVIVAPNRRGVPGFGKAWNEQISGDYGGQNMKDYLAAIDNVKEEKWVNKDKLGAVGASYGGFSVYWLAGHHEKRFKAFIAHDGMFNLEQQYLETEEMWFVNWDLGGPYWEKSNQVAQRSFANSPHRFVDKWDTPILVVHGELDYRIVASQGMAAFNAAQLRGIPSEYLYFPDKNHWVLHPQNSILWQRVFFNWLDRWLK